MFTNHTTNKRIISKIYIQLTNNKNNKKWAEPLNRHFYKGDIQMAKRHMKRFSTPLTNKNAKPNYRERYYLLSVRMAIISNPTNNRS